MSNEDFQEKDRVMIHYMHQARLHQLRATILSHRLRLLDEDTSDVMGEESEDALRRLLVRTIREQVDA